MCMAITVLENGTPNQICIWDHFIFLDIDEIVSIALCVPSILIWLIYVQANSIFSPKQKQSLPVGMAADSPCGPHTPHKVSTAHSSLSIFNDKHQSQLPCVFLIAPSKRMSKRRKDIEKSWPLPNSFFIFSFPPPPPSGLFLPSLEYQERQLDWGVGRASLA